MPIHADPPPMVVQAANSWNGLAMTWTGWNGTVIDLIDATGGTVMIRDGIRGLGAPDFQRYADPAPAQAGSRYLGSRTLERAITWNVFVNGASTDEWLARDSALWATLRPDAVGVWEVTAPGRMPRRLTCRLDSTQDGFDTDPAMAGWASYVIGMVADDEPYWCGETVTRTFTAPADSAFFMTSGGVIHISSGNTTSNASIPNPGDVDAWPTWQTSGGHSGGTLGAGGGTVVVPAIADGHTWTIDTRPSVQTATDQDGVDRTGAVEWNAMPVPKGASADLVVNLTSPDSSALVTCSLVPLHFRAW